MNVQTSSKRVALITGSGKRRIGNHIAVKAAERGYSVALHFNTSAKEAEDTALAIEKSGGEAKAFQADISDEGAVSQLIDNVLAAFGRIDLLVTCASIWAPIELEQVTADDVRRNFDINALGTFLCCQKSGLIMATQPEGGCIVTIGDWASSCPYTGYSAYFPSKGAIPTMTRTFAVELAQRNPRVRVNCILPGPVMLPDDIAEIERQKIAAATLLKRLGTPEHVAQAVFFFAENDFVTGACLAVDGGRSLARG